MKALEEIKAIIEGKNTTTPFAHDIDILIRDTQVLTENSNKIRNALDTLQNFGINLALSVDFKNAIIKVFDYDFEELVKIGFYPKIEDTKGIIEIDGVNIEAQLPKNLAEQLNKIVKPFHFWFSDKQANSLKTFKTAIKQIPPQSIEHHAYNGDFENWFEEALQRQDLKRKVKELKEEHWEGEDLRNKLIEKLEETAYY